MSYIPPSDSVNVLNTSGSTINPATDETVQLLRRMVKILDSIATVDSQNRQRVTLDAANTGANVSIVQSAQANLNATVFQATAGNLNATVAQATAANLNANVGLIAGIDPRFQFMESARISYATGIRPNLQFS